METIFYVPFDGVNGATEWPEEIRGLVPVIVADVVPELDTSQKQGGTASLKALSSGGIYYQLVGQHGPDFDTVVYARAETWPTGTDTDQYGLCIYNGPSTAVIYFSLSGEGANPTTLITLGDGGTSDTYETTLVNGNWYKFTIKTRGTAATLEIADVEVCNLEMASEVLPVSMALIWSGRTAWYDEWGMEGTKVGLPMLQIQGEIDSHQFAWLPALSISAKLLNAKYITGTVTLPLQVVYGSLVAGPHADLSQKLPALRGGIQVENALGQVYAREAGGSGAFFEKKIPKVTLSAGATREGSANLSKAISRITLTSLAHTDTNGALLAAIPAVRISATGTIGQAASLSKPIPMVRLTASAIAGMIGSLQKSIPAVKIDANSYWLSGASLQKSIPAIRISARVEGILAEIIALALNTKNFGLSKYTSYPYNSLCVFNGSVIGAKSSGVYELSGTTDDGTGIAWKLRTPLINLDKNKLRNVWLHGTLSGDIKMVVETADGERYEYDAEPVSESDDAVRIKVGRGLDSRYVIIEFQNESDQSVTIDKIQGHGMKL